MGRKKENKIARKMARLHGNEDNDLPQPGSVIEVRGEGMARFISAGRGKVNLFLWGEEDEVRDITIATKQMRTIDDNVYVLIGDYEITSYNRSNGLAYTSRLLQLKGVPKKLKWEKELFHRREGREV